MAALVDPGPFAELCDNVGEEFALELVDTFLDEAPRMLAGLRAAVVDSDPDAYRRAAHSLKSNAATFGAAVLAGLARDAELTGFTGDASSDEAVLDAIDGAYAAAATELKGLARG